MNAFIYFIYMTSGCHGIHHFLDKYGGIESYNWHNPLLIFRILIGYLCQTADGAQVIPKPDT